MRKLRVGIAGLGEFGELHTMAFSQIPYVEVTRVCSRSKSRAKEIAQKYGIPFIHTDYEEFATASDLDVVSVVTLGNCHSKVVIPALETGKHVLVEKPLADTLEDAQLMIRTAEKARGKFMVGHICRFMHEYSHAKKLISLGKLGDICLIQSWRNNHYTTLSPGMKKSPIHETMVHDIDLALWFTGAEPISFYGYKRFTLSEKEADSGLVIARLSNDTMCSFSSSWLGRDMMTNGLDARMKIIGTKGEIEINKPSNQFVHIDDNKCSHFSPETSLSPTTIVQTALYSEIEYFLKCILDDKDPEIITPQEALLTLETAIKIDEAAIKIYGSTVRMDELSMKLNEHCDVLK